MNIQYSNCPDPYPIDAKTLPQAPAFLSYQPNFAKMETIAAKYTDTKQIIVIGHGGSITSFAGMYYALQESATKQAHIISTVDPDAITAVKKIASPVDTLVIAISKSGETTTQIEALMQFLDYPLLFVTGSMGPLMNIAEKLGAEVVQHPPIGGRYTGMTEVALLPALLCGLDVYGMFESAKAEYARYEQENDAYQAATILYQLEDQGTVDVFMPVYDAHLFPLTNLIVQLCHESFGKAGKGQTYFAHEAPESQHHTNQRFFGGRKNIAGWFMSTEKPLQPIETRIPESIQSITMKDHTLGALNNIPLHTALEFEREGTIEDAQIHGLPVIDQRIEMRSPYEIGKLIAFWQLYAVYASVLRQVDPFDQPQVENSKKISFSKRLGYKGSM